MKRLLLLSIAFFLSACPNSSRLVSPNPPQIVDSQLCGSACERLSTLGCDEGKPVGTGIACNGDWECGHTEQCVNRWCFDTCEHFCSETQAWGVWLDPTCVSQINSCNEIDTCPTPVKNKN